MTPDPDLEIFVDRSDSVRLALLGPDRAKFLHNLTTNEIKRRPVGSGCETFVTSPQGKTIGYFSALIGKDEILLRTNPGGLELALPHFEKYGLFDDVQREDRTLTTFEFHMAGEHVEGRFAEANIALPGPENFQHLDAMFADRPIKIIRESPFGIPGLTIIAECSQADFLRDSLTDRVAHGKPLSPEAIDGLRIEAGTPEFGRDISAENLPQEIGRDEQAISFVKGCYLGQETVARLDALGHVNKMLKGLRIESETLPQPGTTLSSADGKPAGTVTSVGISPRTGEPKALGMIRMAYPPGTRLTYNVAGQAGFAIVSNLPMFALASRTSVG